MAKKTEPTTSRTEPHSFRCNGEIWKKGRKRAASEGVSISHVINEFLEGYAKGKINLPKVTKTYDH